MDLDLQSTFGPFAGREVRKDREDDTTLADIRRIASANGLNLRAHWPGSGAADGYKQDRLNVYLEQIDDGKWRVAHKFNIG